MKFCYGQINETNSVDFLSTVLCTNLVTKNTNNTFGLSTLKLIYCCLLIVLAVLNFVYSIVWVGLICKSYQDIQSISQAIYLTTQSCIPIAILFMTLRTRDEVVGLYKTLFAADKIVFQLGLDVNQIHVPWQWILLWNFIAMFPGLLCDLFGYGIVNHEQCFAHLTLPSYVTYYVCLIYVILTKIYFTLWLLITKKKFEFLNDKMKELCYRPARTEERRLIVKLIKQLLNTLVFLLQSLNQKYSLQCLISNCTFVVTAAPLISFIITRLMGINEQGIVPATAICYIFWVFYGFVIMTWLVHVCGITCEAANNMATVIHDLVTTGEVDDVANELFDFSISLLHLDFHFTACDFFRIDYTLIYMMGCSITSYLVYLIQFEVSSKSMRILSSNSSTF